jgi:hypothetical protein
VTNNVTEYVLEFFAKRSDNNDDYDGDQSQEQPIFWQTLTFLAA